MMNNYCSNNLKNTMETVRNSSTVERMKYLRKTSEFILYSNFLTVNNLQTYLQILRPRHRDTCFALLLLSVISFKIFLLKFPENNKEI